MAVSHGINIYENATSVVTPIEAENAIVCIGTAPVHVGTETSVSSLQPVVCYTAEEAMKKLGYSEDFEKYTLCQMMYLQKGAFPVSPVVYINVYDPYATGTESSGSYAVAGLTKNKVVDIGEVIRTSISVYQGQKTSNNKVFLRSGRDYTLEIKDNLHTEITLIIGGDSVISTEENAQSVWIYFRHPRSISSVTTANLVSGAAKIQNIYPKYGIIPSIVICPKYSKTPEVGAALIANAANIDGIFKGIAYLDLDTTENGARVYTNAKTVKEDSGYTSPYCVPLWPCFKMGNGAVFAMSSVAACLTAYIDAQDRGVPHRSYSNRMINQTGAGVVGLCLEDGTEVVLGQDQATHVNTGGVTTAINMSGWRMWGSYTGAYPSINDVKDMWAPVRRMFNWHGNNFILTYFGKVDDPINYVLIESVVDSENIRCQAYAPDVWAGAEIEFSEEDNPVTELLAGHITFRQRIAPYTPAQEIDNVLSYDTAILMSSLTSEE